MTSRSPTSKVSIASDVFILASFSSSFVVVIVVADVVAVADISVDGADVAVVVLVVNPVVSIFNFSRNETPWVWLTFSDKLIIEGVRDDTDDDIDEDVDDDDNEDKESEYVS